MYAVAGMYQQVPSLREVGYLSQASLLRKDFKIRGIVGNPGQKDSLIYQIIVAKSSG